MDKTGGMLLSVMRERLYFRSVHGYHFPHFHIETVSLNAVLRVK